MKKIATLLVVGLTAAAAAGCGGGSGGGGSLSDYQKKLASVGKDVRGGETGLRRVATSGGSASAQLRKLRAGLRKGAGELSKITPPGDAKSDNDKLASGLRDLANEVGPIEKAAKSHSASALQSALSTLQSSGGVTKIRDAINDLKLKGYSNFGPGTRSTT